MTSEHLTDEIESSSLLPTPNASDDKGGEGPTRWARQEEGSTGGPALKDIGHLLPTPTGQLLPTPMQSDGEKGSRNQAFGTGSPTLSSALQEDRLLPTPVANPDNPGAGGELRAAIEHGPGRRNETGIDSMGRPNRGRSSQLLPTPNTRDAGGAARHTTTTEAMHGGTSLTDATRVMAGDPRGDPTKVPSGGGRQSSPEPHPAQLTIEDV